ncbi:MAG: MFS transporter [Anaerolineaceae bacterium]|nr:MFS transporter [Anaerolineaceae bacterium]MDD4042465.1 MFS transporter [Anaerolineaceae bacterium]MDD4578594.1 MFS transporter [Anaerolineaceae bacterium]
MATLLLLVIYLAFISLGLPDSMLGAAWPLMQFEMGLPLEGAGLVSMIVTAGTIVSSLLTGKLIKKLGTGLLTTLSVLTTALALLGYSFTTNYLWLCLMAVPLGLGAGAVDAALNDFVARNYSAKHMSWLHAFWGVGATAGPLLMAWMISLSGRWQNGYRLVSIVQFGLVAILIASLPLWRKTDHAVTEAHTEKHGNGSIWKIPGMVPNLLAFFAYCALELTAGLWFASYLVQVRGVKAETATAWAASYYFGIMLGRMINGFLTMRFSSKTLIRAGQTSIFIGILLLFVPGNIFSLVGLVLVGMGCAPIYPSLLHETPTRFGKENSSRLMGIQMASAYVGLTVAPPLVGLIASRLSLRIFPFALLILLALMVWGSERVNGVVAGNRE